MKALIVGLVAVMGLGVAAEARATNLNNSGTICKNYNAGEVTDIDYLTYGTRNLNASARSVICPLVRSPRTDNTATGYIDFKHFSSVTTTCTVYSYDYNGTFLGSTSVSGSGTGAFDKYFALGASQATYWANLAVLCTVPGSAQSLIMDVDLVQP